MNNSEFLKVISQSFLRSLETHARSNEKLKVLHPAVAIDFEQRLGGGFETHSLGKGDGKELAIVGRYMSKTLDIVVTRSGKPVAGVGVKFVMSNYSQNSNNYFEGMLGETANIRSKRIPYFQIVVIPSRFPYYLNDGGIDRWEIFPTENFVKKYLVLATDNIDQFMHTPVKTLLVTVVIPSCDETNVIDRQSYKQHYLQIGTGLKFEYLPFKAMPDPALILNDYEEFARKSAYYIKSV